MKPSESRSNQPTARQSLISDWLTRLALNSGVPLEPGTRAVYTQLWMDSFADLDDVTLDAAFRKTLLTWKFPTLPKVGDIRGHLDVAAKQEQQSRIEQEWQKLREYIRRFWWRDGGSEYWEKVPKRPDRVRVACAAAGGMEFLSDCSEEELVWAKKRFVESYTTWEEMGKDQWLLPKGHIRNLLARTAEKLLPQSGSATAEPERYAILKKQADEIEAEFSGAADWLPPVTTSVIHPQDTLKECPEHHKFSFECGCERPAAAADMTHAETITGETMVLKDPNRMELLKQQAEKMKAKYPSPGAKAEGIPAELRPVEVSA